MTNGFIPPSEFLTEKNKIVENDLKQAAPLVIASTKEGILLITENPNLSRKIAEVYDRIAFGAIGKYVKFKKLKKQVISLACIEGASYARQDVGVEDLADQLGDILDEVDSAGYYKVLSWSVEIALAEVNDIPEHDKILVIFHNGTVIYNPQAYVVLGRNDALKAKLAEIAQAKKFQDMNFNEAIEAIKGAILSTRTSNGNGEESKKGKKKNSQGTQDVVFEIAVLRRAKTGPKFERINGGAS